MKPAKSFVDAAKEWVKTGKMEIPPRHLPKRFHIREVELHGQNTRTNSTFTPPMTNGVPSIWLL